MGIKQVIVIRKDLGMSKGKACSQAAHASLGAIISPDNYIIDGEPCPRGEYHFHDEVVIAGVVENRSLVTHMIDDAVKGWLEGSFAKVCLSVNSEEELINLSILCKNKNIRSFLVKDEGRTQLKGPSYTCIAIGPDYSKNINEITSSLKLY